ncbi:hypothetical protein EV122DRAFT_263509 [Schizophyllum commune]
MSESSESKPRVVVIGATGSTGTSIVNGLLRSGNFVRALTWRVAVVVRSASKPVVVDFQERGAEVLLHQDLTQASHDELVALFKGADIVVSALTAYLLDTQRPLFAAAKDAGVKRVVPCDWSSHAPPGAMLLQDMKYDIQKYIRELGLGYTVIEVGIWLQVLLPYPPSYAGRSGIVRLSHTFHEPGEVPTAGTDINNIGAWVALILADARTLNHTVFVWEAQATQRELYRLAAAKGVDAEALDKLVTTTTEAELKAKVDEGARAGPTALRTRALPEYAYSMWYRGDNTVERAVQDGALDARALYPDRAVLSLDEFAQSWYGNMLVPA